MFDYQYFFFFYFIHYVSYEFLYLLTNKFSGHKQVNISFYDIKYFDLRLSLNFSVFLLVIINNFYLFIYINDY
jgi:hypothetical protein